MNQVYAFVVLCLVATVNGFVVQAPAALSRGQFVSRTATSQVLQICCVCFWSFSERERVVVMKSDRGSAPSPLKTTPCPDSGMKLPLCLPWQLFCDIALVLRLDHSSASECGSESLLTRSDR